ncbi:hypothetical protein OAX78_00640 [Planctomycetota bacterium]|nr:hypothetical protein [Planctomycetota bacterium]
MSDEKLRELERRSKQSGAVEDEAAFLLARVRTANLALERLELAAYCGHEGAQAALSTYGADPHNPRQESNGPPADLGQLLVSLEPWGRWALATAAIAAATRAIDAVERHGRPELLRLLALSRSALDLRSNDRPPEADEVYRSLTANHFAGNSPAFRDDPAWRATAAVLAAFRAATGRYHAASAAVQDAAFVAGDAAVREGVLGALRTWAVEAPL